MGPPVGQLNLPTAAHGSADTVDFGTTHGAEFERHASPGLRPYEGNII